MPSKSLDLFQREFPMQSIGSRMGILGAGVALALASLSGPEIPMLSQPTGPGRKTVLNSPRNRNRGSGDGAHRAAVRAMQQQSWQREYYRDTPLPSFSRQTIQHHLRDGAKRKGELNGEFRGYTPPPASVFVHVGGDRVRRLRGTQRAIYLRAYKDELEHYVWNDGNLAAHRAAQARAVRAVSA